VPLSRLGLDGPLCTYFAGVRQRLFAVREVLDPKPKHRARQLISVAVRTTFTAREADGFDLVCAKGSVKPPTSADPAAQNHHMLRLYYGSPGPVDRADRSIRSKRFDRLMPMLPFRYRPCSVIGR